MRRPENSPGSPAQWPAVSTSFGAMMVPEQRNAGLPGRLMTRTYDAHECVRSAQAAASGAREGPMGGATADLLEAVPAFLTVPDVTLAEAVLSRSITRC